MTPFARRTVVALALALGAAPALAAAPLARPAARCQREIGVAGVKFKKVVLNASRKCLEGLLVGKPCNAPLRDARIANATDKYATVVRRECDPSHLFTAPPAGVGFAQSCVLEAGELEPAEQACAALAVTDAESLARCLACWKRAELNELLAIVYPCLATQGPPGSDLDCGTPPAACPTDKHDIGCTKAVAKVGAKFLLAKEQALEKCLDAVNRGRNPGPCPDAKADEAIAKAEAKLHATVLRCNVLPPWWNVCPEVCALTIATVDDMGTCVDLSAEAIADELICLQYPGAATNGIACPLD